MKDPDALIHRSGISGDPGTDQHFLIDDRVLDRLPSYADDFDLSHVLEIGAGTGALTDRLLAVARRVTAVERDRRLISFLQNEFRDAIDRGRLDILEGDAVQVEFPDFTSVISNLPYGPSSELLFRLLPTRRPLVVMVQQEFGERLVAEPGTEAYGRLSVTAGHYAEIELVESVPPTAFRPEPAVESVVVRARPKDPEYSVADEEFFLRFVMAVFTQRRKTMRNAIRNTTHISGIKAPEEVLAEIDDGLLSARPGTLSPLHFAAIADLAQPYRRQSDAG